MDQWGRLMHDNKISIHEKNRKTLHISGKKQNVQKVVENFRDLRLEIREKTKSQSGMMSLCIFL